MHESFHRIMIMYTIWTAGLLHSYSDSISFVPMDGLKVHVLTIELHKQALNGVRYYCLQRQSIGQQIFTVQICMISTA